MPHLWILRCLGLVDAAKNMIFITSNSMVNWKTVLTSGGVELGQVDIRRGIFQGDSVVYSSHADTDHLLFMDDLKL